MRPGSCLGIFRERAHSPGREFDDAEILRLTSKHLEAAGFEVELRAPDQVPGAVDRPPAAVFLMCERPGVLGRLLHWERSGVVQVNSPAAVLNTFRHRMMPLCEGAGIPFPRSAIVATAAVRPEISAPVWVKRGDVHNTQDGDVVFAPDALAARAALAGLARRGIPRAVLQAHVAGDLIKFYGVGDPGRMPGLWTWFRWFYHKDQQVAGYPFEPGRLAAVAQRAAAALGLQVYGGDAIVGPGGEPVVIDVNAWPSFALYRDEAAERIAAYLAARFRAGDGAYEDPARPETRSSNIEIRNLGTNSKLESRSPKQIRNPDIEIRNVSSFPPFQ